MAKKYECPGCGKKTLEIVGAGGYGDTVETVCSDPDCGETFELEPDGLGDGGLEMVAALMMDEDFCMDDFDF